MKHLSLFIFLFFALNICAQTGDNYIDNLLKVPSTPDVLRTNGSNWTNPMQNTSAPTMQQQIQMQNNRIIEQYYRELAEYEQNERNKRQAYLNHLVNRGFPSQAHRAGTQNFRNAFAEIDSMLQGKKELNFARALFLVENCYYDNQLKYSDYQNFIKRKVDLCNQKIKEERLNSKNNMVKNMMIFRLISDTLVFKMTINEQTKYHLPIRYDYDDYKSEKNYDSHFVTKLMQSGVGQCLSMPLYYLILAEAMGAEAYLAFSPHHSFIKIKDENGRWHNLELTCNSILSDAHYVNHSYIKAEAIRNRLYLEPLDKKQVIAEMLVRLGGIYREKYDYDDFYLKCAETAEQYLDNKLHTVKMKAAYKTALTTDIAKMVGARNGDELKAKVPQAYFYHQEMLNLYKQIDDMGYEETPVSIYESWLEHIAKQKGEYENRRKQFFNQIK